MRKSIGILAETYSLWERRAPLTPQQVGKLVQQRIEVLVQPSTRRIFRDAEYAKVGATITTE